MTTNDPVGVSMRLREALEEKGTTQAALSRHCGVSTAAVAKWVYQGTISDINILKAARFLGVSERWLATGEGSKTPESTPVLSYLPGEETAPPTVVTVPVYRLGLSAGEGRAPEWEEMKSSEPVWFPASFFACKGISPDRCKVAFVAGDSMSPTMVSGDQLLWESYPDDSPAPEKIVDGRIYVISIDGLYKVKRLRKTKDGILVVSDNPAYPPEEYVGEECNRIRIYGHALHVSRAL